MKYDKIVEISKERSRQNTEVALRAIEEMLREGEWITVAELAKRTKLSRANFYVNKDIRKSLEVGTKQSIKWYRNCPHFCEPVFIRTMLIESQWEKNLNIQNSIYIFRK